MTGSTAVLVFAILMVFVGTPSAAPAQTAVKESRANRDQAVRELLKEVAPLTKALSGLDQNQRAAIVGLVAATKAVSSYQRSHNHPSQELIRRFDGLVEGLAPPAAKALGISGLGRGCLDESIAYAGSMSRCLKEGKTADECERQSAPEAAGEIACMMKQLEALMKQLRVIGRGPFPGPR